MITTKSNQPTPPSSAKLGLLKIQLFFFFFPLGRNTPLVRTLGVQAPGFDIVQGGACQGPNFRGDSNLDFGRGGQSEELTRSPHSKKLETDKQRLDREKIQRVKSKKYKTRECFAVDLLRHSCPQWPINCNYRCPVTAFLPNYYGRAPWMV